jgi:anti-sigma regulatory factor (Ser/Thr protein kinase)
MSDRGAAVAANPFTFESTDPSRDKTRFFSELRAFGQTCGWSQPIANEIELVLEEWWTNLINYAFTQTDNPVVNIEIISGGSLARIQVTDNGIPFDPAARPDPDLSLPIEERPIGGLGIYMMKKLSNSLKSERSGDRNILRIDKDLNHPVLGVRS